MSQTEFRFALIISSSHLSQHVYMRILPPLIPVLAVALEYPLWQLGLLISLYSLGMGVVQAPIGMLSDRIDRRYLLPTGLSLTGAAYVLFSFAPTLGTPLPSIFLFGHSFEGGYLVMSLAMVIVGIGLAVVHPTGYPMITDNSRDSTKGKVLGMFGASSKFGDAAAPAIIAVLILLLAWQQIVLLFGIGGFLFGVVLFAVLGSDEYETLPTGQRTEDTQSVSTDSTDGDRRTYLYPMVAVYFFFVSSMLSTRGLNSFLPVFVVAVYAFSFEFMGFQVGPESVASVYFSLLLLSGAVMQLSIGGLADTYDPRHILLGCLALATVGMVALAQLSLGPVLLVLVIVVLGTGLYGLNPARDTLISDLTPPEYEGRTFGYIFTAVSLTGAPLPAGIGYLLDGVGMREGFLLLAIGPLLAGLFIGLLYSDRVYLPKGT